jgi:hypothetical protein
MEAILILGGLLLLLYALVWLIGLAFTQGPLWGWCSLLLPPVLLVFILRFWEKTRNALLLAGLACVPMIAGLTQLAAEDSERLQAIFTLDWLQPAAKADVDLGIELSGTLAGRTFAPQSGEFIDGVLTLREVRDLYALQELRIRLPEQPAGALRLDVLPQDSGPLPVIELSWLLPEQELPEAWRINGGYSLHMDLQPLEQNRLRGAFHLILPARYKTALSGTLEVYTDQLRYRNGKLDTRHDSTQTLEKIIIDYLQRRFRSRAVDLEALPPQNFVRKHIDLSVSALIDGVEQQVPVRLIKSEHSGWTVEADQYPPLAAAKADADEPEQKAEIPALSIAQPDRRPGFSLQRLLDNPQQYQNLALRVRSERGSLLEGRFDGLDSNGRLLIKPSMGAMGEASFTVRPAEISEIWLLEP